MQWVFSNDFSELNKWSFTCRSADDLTTQQSFIPHNLIYLFVVYQIAKSIQISGYMQISVANKLDLQSPFDVVYHIFIRNHSAILLQCIHRGFTTWTLGFMPIIIGDITHLSPLNYITHRCPMTKMPANTHFQWFTHRIFLVIHCWIPVPNSISQPVVAVVWFLFLGFVFQDKCACNCRSSRQGRSNQTAFSICGTKTEIRCVY